MRCLATEDDDGVSTFLTFNLFYYNRHNNERHLVRSIRFLSSFVFTCIRSLSFQVFSLVIRAYSIGIKGEKTKEKTKKD